MSRKLTVYKDTVIYILGLPQLISGGPEALHQLVYYLKKCNYNAVLAYPQNTTGESYEIADKYKKYVDCFISFDDITDDEKNIIVFPEGRHLQYYSKYKKSQKAVWFLSVNNFRSFYNRKKTIKEKIDKICHIVKYRLFSVFDLDFVIKNDNTVKLAASYYAYDYLKKRNGSPEFLIEPVSMEFIDYYKGRNYSFDTPEKREDIILYNPVKGDNEFMASNLQEFLSGYKFIPIKGYSHDEMIELMNRAKLYIDFGTFPGAERIPKEAVVCGMCVLTGRNGASDFHGDVPIPDKYKFKKYKKQIPEIANTIREIMDNYSDKVCDFDEYRQTVYNLEGNFLKQLEKVFVRTQK